MTTTATDSEMRMPDMICGSAAGIITLKRERVVETRYDFTMSRTPGSMARMPSTVLSRIGQMHANAIAQIFGSGVMPKAPMMIGMMATWGIDLANCRYGS